MWLGNIKLFMQNTVICQTQGPGFFFRIVYFKSCKLTAPGVERAQQNFVVMLMQMKIKAT